MPHERVTAPGHDRQRGLGLLAVAWIEHFGIHGPGDIEGTPLNPAIPGAIPLSDELAGFTMDCYALGADGRRLYDSAFLSRPKGAMKSEWQAFIVLFEGAGPCRFLGWAKGGEIYEQGSFRYIYTPGEAMGRPVRSPYIRILATEEGQAGHIYDTVYLNFTHEVSRLKDFLRHADDAALGRIALPNGGEIVPSTASSSAKDGGKETFVAFDETHLYITPELRRMYATVRRNLAKRKDAEPWSSESSTMYEPGRASVAEATHELALSIRAGKVANPRLLFDHREAPKDADMNDDSRVYADLADAYGDATSYMDFSRLVSEMRDPRNSPDDSRRFFFNQAHAGSSLAFDYEAWKRGMRPQVTALGRLITLGFDGARTQDSTALIATDVETGFQWPIGIWEKPDNARDWLIDETAVDAAVDDAFRDYEVWRMYGDPSKWEMAMARWAGRYGHERVVALPPAMSRRSALMFSAYASAIRGGDVTHSGDPVFSSHIANAHRYTITAKDDDGNNLWIIQKDRVMSPRKIDAAWAGAASWQARLDAVAEGAKPRRKKALVFIRE